MTLLARHARRAVTVCLVIAASALASCGDADSDRGTSSTSIGNTRFVAGSGAITTIPPAEREAAPQLRGMTLDGGEIDLAQYRGKVVVLNVWEAHGAPHAARKHRTSLPPPAR